MSMGDQPSALRMAPTREILDDLPVGLLVVDADRAVLHENDTLRDLWGELIRQPPDALFPADAYDADGARLEQGDWPIWEALERGTAADDLPIELERPDGDPISIVVSTRPIHDPSHRRAGAVMLVREVTEERERDELHEAFIGVLSHELRTPITSIYSGIELLRRHRLDPSVRTDVIDDIAVEAESLYRIVDDLLVMVRLEAGTAVGLQEPVLVRPVVEATVADERRRWPTTTFDVRLPKDLPAVRADDGLLRQVLRNLLSNAAKYGRPDGTVTIRGEAIPGVIRVRVQDDGPGIKGDGERLFDLLVRGDTSRQLPGAGIGLFVARSLVEGMGGRLHLGAPPVGAEFIIDLPIYEDVPSD